MVRVMMPKILVMIGLVLFFKGEIAMSQPGETIRLYDAANIASRTDKRIRYVTSLITTPRAGNSSSTRSGAGNGTDTKKSGHVI